ncbi:MAG: FtsW/RodA/SpoVE family cell cycle protein, partial [Clostridiales bacterium]|nr:FtsW/RodA/SpoVE family cell cycle protein [Clostridiales bacterium]
MFKDNVLVRFFREMDKVIIFTALIASAYGLSLVYSATYRKLEDGQLFTSDITSMLISIGLGLVFVVIVSNIDYEIISKLWPVIAAGCVILMIITMIWGVAVNPLRDDTKSWLKIGSFTFQTSEILKVGFVISYAYHIDLVKQKINEPLQMAGLIAHGLVPFLLVMFTGDLGSAIIFIVMMIGMLFMARAHILYFVAGGAALAIVTPIAWRYEWISGIQRDRILALFYPEDYPPTIYPQENAKIAMGSGGLTGQGYLNGTYTQSGLVPENQNDMILSVAGEEFGFLGALAVIALLTILI